MDIFNYFIMENGIQILHKIHFLLTQMEEFQAISCIELSD